MRALPNPLVPLVQADGSPSRSLLALMPDLSAGDVIADRQGLPTPLFLTRLKVPGNARAPLFNEDGTPTRAMTMLLMEVTR